MNFDKTPVAQATARTLQEMIRSGELKRDEKIPSQRVLSQQLNVSRTSLREALLTLETLGFVRTFPARGTFVVGSQIKSKQPDSTWRYGSAYTIREVFQTRLLIEVELVRLAAGAIGVTSLDALENAAGKFESAWYAGDIVTHVDADLEFHRTIAESCPNRMLVSLYYSVLDLLTETQRQPIPNTETDRMKASMVEHRAIVHALRKNDPVAAQQAMKTHILNTARCTDINLP